MSHILAALKPRVLSSDLVWGLPTLLLSGLCIIGWILGIVLIPISSYLGAALLMALVIIPPVAVMVFLKAASGVRWAFMLMVFAVVFLSDSTLRAKAAGDTGMDTQSIVKFIVWFSGVALLPWVKTQVANAVRTPSVGFLFAFGLWAVCTSAYSITPAYTLAAGVSFIGIWTIAVTAGERISIVDGLGIVLVALLAALSLSLLMYFVVPDRALTPMEGGRIFRLSGFFGSPNNLGRAAALALMLVMVYWLYGSKRVSLFFSVAIVPPALGCLVLSGSRTSLLGLVAGITYVAARRKPMIFFTLITLLAFTILLISFSSLHLHDLIRLISRTGRVSELTTFTGRTEIWSWVLSAIYKEPLLGYGFASTRELIPAGYFTAYGWTTTSAHNLWLQTWVTTGAIGLAMVLASQLASFRDMVEKSEPARDSIIVFILAVGLMEAGPIGPSVNLLTFIWIWAATLSIRPGKMVNI
jgi:O-antigen ligase